MFFEQSILLAIALEYSVKLIEALILVFAAHFIIHLLDNLLIRLFNWTRFEPTLEKFIHKSMTSLLWLLVVAILLVIFGVDVNSVVVSFGALSFIVGFALKDALSNLAAGVMVLLNTPFYLEDEIEVKNMRGKVKTITMTYTKLVDKQNNKIILPNSIVWGNPITNYTAYNKTETPSTEK